MFEFIEKMRKKPEGERHRFVFMSAVSVTLVIAAVWGTSVAYRIHTGSLSFKIAVPETSELSNIGQRLSDSWGDFFPEENTSAPQSVSSSTESRYPALEEIFGDREAATSEESPVILDEPQTEYYPADIYSN